MHTLYCYIVQKYSVYMFVFFGGLAWLHERFVGGLVFVREGDP